MVESVHDSLLIDVHTYSGIRSGAIVCVVFNVLLFHPCIEKGAGGGETTIAQC